MYRQAARDTEIMQLHIRSILIKELLEAEDTDTSILPHNNNKWFAEMLVLAWASEQLYYSMSSALTHSMTAVTSHVALKLSCTGIYSLSTTLSCRPLGHNEDRTTAQQTRDALLSRLHNDGISSPSISGQQKLCTAFIREWEVVRSECTLGRRKTQPFVSTTRGALARLMRPILAVFVFPHPRAWMWPCRVSFCLLCGSPSEAVRYFSKNKLDLTRSNSGAIRMFGSVSLQESLERLFKQHWVDPSTGTSTVILIVFMLLSSVSW